MTKTLLSINKVRQSFGNVVAVDNVSLDLEPGEFVTLLGPSGCGKTSLLRMVAGFARPETGSISLGDTEITNVPPERRPFNMVFQRYALFPHLTVAGNVAYGLANHGIHGEDQRAKIRDALEMVDLAEYGDRRINALSGGQQQRVALARALVNEPQMLLLDEPLSALDRQLRLKMQVELRRLQRRLGITFLFVTHDQEEALTMSDRIVVMNAGRIEQIGTPEEIYLRPKTRFVASFVGENNLIPAQFVDGSVTPCAEEEAGGWLVIAPEQWERLAGGDVTVEGEMTQSLFLGSTFRSLVRLPDGTDLKVDGNAPLAEAGEKVSLAIDTSGAWFVPRNGS